MARNVTKNYFEDSYVKYECTDCKRCFIVGMDLSTGMNLACPYCQSINLELLVISDSEDDLGCLGIYYHLYADGTLMLHTEAEFAQAIKAAISEAGNVGVPLTAANDIIGRYCSMRDGRSISDKGAVTYG